MLNQPSFGSVASALFALAVALPTAPSADLIVINNGLAPPNPANVLDEPGSHDDWIRVQNVGCDAGSEYPCSSPGAPTEVRYARPSSDDTVYVYETSKVTIETHVWRLHAHDSSTLIMKDSGGVSSQAIASNSSTLMLSDGFVSELVAEGNSIVVADEIVRDSTVIGGSATVTLIGGYTHEFSLGESATLFFTGGTADMGVSARESSTLIMTGGLVESLAASEAGTVTMSGGTVQEGLSALGSASITLAGTGFAVDGVPVPYGALAAQTGRLTGTLLSGDPIDNVFYQGGYDNGSYVYSGMINLVPEPGTALLVACGLVGLTMWRRRSAQRAPELTARG